ncbi:Ubiquitin-like modifier-activating enzyme 1 [Oopsacas minuta]|uniref:E1 ubiquitin-activating enzyme n=1 Tax=Oopsacas minuta TaxID=111878 RepID=A0AAV7JZG6_9METZ|nr:Ubiquitin-like modifier-activating enzyme 1 [Oopsacas minuta]
MTADVEMTDATKRIDEDLYSRQLYVLGHEAMKLFQDSSVLICGMKAMGVEIAKNVILAGPKAVTLRDNSLAQLEDLGCNYFLRENMLGTARCEAVVNQLTELNSYVQVQTYVGELSEEVLNKFRVVVLCDASFSDQLIIGDICHTNGIKFISVCSFGLFGNLFCDFGDKFVVVDKNGEQPSSCLVQHISRDNEGIVTCNEETRHDLETGDFVTFSEIVGMEGLNNSPPREVTVITPYSFSIGDTSELNEYTDRGVVTECKTPITVEFKSLRDSLKDPEFLISDFAKFDRPGHLLKAFQALDVFVAEKGELPRPYNKEDADVLLDLTKKFYNGEEELSKDVITKLSYVCRGELMPVISFLGGLAAQEVVKACTGKFMPLKQFMFFDALECLPAEDKLPFQQTDYPNDRYSKQRLVFGQAFHDKLSNQGNFVVGAGALGCEFLKNFAMMGVGCGPNGHIVITDMDIIERSNLNRQFLFRPWDMGKCKSTVAADAAWKMNPSLKIESLLERVGPDTEHIYNDKFFSLLSCVTNALDNVDARKYMDRRCVYYHLPLLESGTLGTKGNVQVVLPFLTESYSSSNDPPEKEYPICTLKNFPNAIQHTVQWARDLFEGVFSKPGRVFKQLQSEPDYIDRITKMPGNEPATILSELKLMLDRNPNNFPDCVAWARLQFEELFSSQIKQLLFNFPPNSENNGVLFWSGSKRCPTPAVFDSTNDTHGDFIESASLLYAEANSISTDGITREQVLSLANGVLVPVFKPREGVKIATTDQEAQEMSTSSGDSLSSQSVAEGLKSLKLPPNLKIIALEFEKDDDSNHHMDFVTSTSNLRAANYQIEQADKHRSKGIAGKIIPAVATTTAAVVGLVCLELYKLVRDQGCSKEEVNHENYKNAFFNLALPFFAFSEPILAEKKKYYETEWTLWDRFEIDGRLADGEMTLGEFIGVFKEKYRLNITMLSQGVALIFAFFTEAKKKKERMEMSVSKAVEVVTKVCVPDHLTSLVLEMCCDDDEGNDVEVPYIKYSFK